MAHVGRTPAPPAVVGWLWSIAAIIALMVLVGGITRMSGSGLSITEWRPVTGALPPLGEADWQALFAKYRASPQFQQDNPHFDLAAFKEIFWWEWGHRLLGRVIGLWVFLPFLFFWRGRRLEPWLVRRVLLLLALGGFQGALGWLMVKSGLLDAPRVSHFRLAAHLLTALLTLAITVWTALEARRGARASPWSAPRALQALTLVLVLQLVWGAFVAGLRAGFLFPTFPKMGAAWFPLAEVVGPLWRAAVADMAVVQFLHRWLGALLLVLALWAAAQLSRRAEWRALACGLAGAAILQFTLGVLAVLFLVRAPMLFGGLHQAGAVLLATVVVTALFFAHTPRAAAVAAPERAPRGAGPLAP